MRFLTETTEQDFEVMHDSIAMNYDRNIVYFYVLLFGNNWAYVGSSHQPMFRIVGDHMHDLQEGCHDSKWMQNIYNKHGLDDFYIFDFCTDEDHRTAVEQLAYNYVKSTGCKMCNAILPKKSRTYLHCTDIDYAEACSKRMSEINKITWLNEETRLKRIRGISTASRNNWQDAEYRRKQIAAYNTPAAKLNRSKGQLKRFETKESRELLSQQIKKTTSTTEWLQGQSKRSKAMWHKQEFRDKISKTYATEDYKTKASARSKKSFENPEYKARITKVTVFGNRYGFAKSVFKFNEETGCFKPYMHFILPKTGQYANKAVVFIWDTREVVAILDAKDVPEGYVKCSKVDSYEPLIFQSKLTA